MDEELLDALIDLLQSGEEIPEEVLDQVIGLLQEEQDQEPIEAPIPPGADLLWILAGENPQAFTQYLQNFPDPALNALARNPTQLQFTIDELSRRVTMPSGESSDGIPKQGLTSSNIYGFQYDPRSGTLRVRFNSGSVYSYAGVPPQVFKMFQSGAVPAKTTGRNRWGQWWRGKRPSSGATFHELIKLGGYPYQKLK